MLTIHITNARKDLYNLVENVNRYNEPALIIGKRGNAILLSEDDWNSIQETLHLNTIDNNSPNLSSEVGIHLLKITFRKRK